MKKKGNVNAVWLIPTAVIALVLGGIVAGLGLEIVGDVQDDMTANSAEYNATGDAITGIAEIPERMDTMGLVIAVSIILAVLVGGFAYFRMGRR